MHSTPAAPLILLTGVSGYVGGRLLPRLERRGLRVRCLARRPEFLARRAGPATQIVAGDALREETLGPALEGVHTAYYLIHLMGSTWLEFEVTPTPAGAAIRQTAIFDPSGLLGRLYGYAVLPLHSAVFRRMLGDIARAAERA